MSEKVSETIGMKYLEVLAERDNLKAQCERMSLAMTTGDRNWTEILNDRDRLAEINKVLVEALEITLNRYEDMTGGFFDEERKRIQETLTKAKEMGK